MEGGRAGYGKFSDVIVRLLRDLKRVERDLFEGHEGVGDCEPEFNVSSSLPRECKRRDT